MQRFFFSVILLFAVSATSQAQTCANPIYIYSKIPFAQSQNSCNSQNSLNFLDAGSVYTPGRDVVYRVVYSASSQVLPVPKIQFTLFPGQMYDAAVFACSQCNQFATCMEASDNVGAGQPETISVPSQSSGYYVIVDSTVPNSGCGPYTITAAATK